MTTRKEYETATTTTAAAAAALIKSTAETTATALNITYIQKDILEIKSTLKDMISNQNSKIMLLEAKIDKISSTVFIGVGMATTIAVVFPFLLKVFVK